MAFAKVSLDRAYATGAIRSNLSLRHLASKLRRAGVAAVVEGGRLVMRSGDDVWSIATWEPDGVGRIGWIEMKVGGDAGTLSRRLAAAGIRHRIDHSRPMEVGVTDVRCVTQYEFHWDRMGLVPSGALSPSIVTYEERL